MSIKKMIADGNIIDVYHMLRLKSMASGDDAVKYLCSRYMAYCRRLYYRLYSKTIPWD